jgi:hypothetical protein
MVYRDWSTAGPGREYQAAAKVRPFRLKGKQPMDAGTSVIAVPDLFGKGGYRDPYDCTVGVRDWMKCSAPCAPQPRAWFIAAGRSIAVR